MASSMYKVLIGFVLKYDAFYNDKTSHLWLIFSANALTAMEVQAMTKSDFVTY